MATRRSALLRLLMWASLAGSYGTALSFAARFLYPRRKTGVLRSVYLARLDDLPFGESRDAVDLRGLPVLVVREGGSVRALSRVCTHLGCRVRWEGDRRRFFCPCHDGVFDSEGKVVSGPPPRPLDQYDVEVIAGNVYIEMKEPVG